jgi:hypothetical protein
VAPVPLETVRLLKQQWRSTDPQIEELAIEAARKQKVAGEQAEAAALRAALARFQVAEPTDRTEFRRKARLMASLWRDAKGLAPAPTALADRMGRRSPASSAAAWNSTWLRRPERTS